MDLKYINIIFSNKNKYVIHRYDNDTLMDMLIYNIIPEANRESHNIIKKICFNFEDHKYMVIVLNTRYDKQKNVATHVINKDSANMRIHIKNIKAFNNNTEEMILIMKMVDRQVVDIDETCSFMLKGMTEGLSDEVKKLVDGKIPADGKPSSKN